MKTRRRSRRCRLPKTNPSLAVGYGRISKGEAELALQIQEADYYRWCATRGIQSVGWQIDQDLSGASRLQDRSGLPRAIEIMRECGAGLLVVTKRDRLARDGIEAAVIERTVNDSGSRIVCIDGTGATDSPTDVFQTRILDAVAELERGFIRARTKRALEHKASKFERVSLISPYGYRFEPSAHDPEKNMVVPVPEELEVLQRILELRKAGRSYNGIAVFLTEEGVPARGAKWYAATVRTLCLRGHVRGEPR